jgi:hypothetical protein
VRGRGVNRARVTSLPDRVMTSYRFAKVPTDGERIGFSNGKLNVPDVPIIPFIEGDGTGPDIWRASRRVFDAAIERAFGGKRRIAWMEVFAGEKAFTTHGDWLPQETVDAMQEFRVSIKGPLTTPVGGGIRSLNVTLRQVLDLYACIRPVRYFEGVGAPVKAPEKVNVVIFRENIEDVYAGIEWKAGTEDAARVRDFIVDVMGKDVREGSAIAVHDRHAIRVDGECGTGILRIVDDDQIEVFGRELLAAPRQSVASLEREAHDDRARSPCIARALKDVGCRRERDRFRGVLLLDLLRHGIRRPKVRWGRGHDQRIGGGKRRAHGVGHFFRRLDAR